MGWGMRSVRGGRGRWDRRWYRGGVLASTTLSGLGSMRCGTVGAGKKTPGGGPGVTLGTGAGAIVGGGGIDAVRETMGTLGDEAGVLKGVGTARSKMVARC